MTKPVTPLRGFSDKWLNSVKPIDRRFEVPDKACRGLRLRVEKSGAKSFVWYYRNDLNKTVGYVIGRYPDISLAKAREELLSLQSLKRTGKLKSKAVLKTEQKERELAELAAKQPLSSVIEEFFAYLCVIRKRPDSPRQLIDHDIIPALGNIPIREVTKKEISCLVNAIIGRGADTAAGRVLALLKQFFDWCVDHDYIDYSPITTLKKKSFAITEGKRDRALDIYQKRSVANYPEITAWSKALESSLKMSVPVKNALKILLLTGMRTGELRLSQWEHVDFERKELFVPAENQKAGSEDWIVPLSDRVIELLQEIQQHHSTGFIVSMDGSKPVDSKALGRANRRLFSKSLDIEPFSPHTLRHTVRSHLALLGVRFEVCEKVLNHSLGKMADLYSQIDYFDERRSALNLWSDELKITSI